MYSAVLPSKIRFSPVRPCVEVTIKSAPKIPCATANLLSRVSAFQRVLHLQILPSQCRLINSSICSRADFSAASNSGGKS